MASFVGQYMSEEGVRFHMGVLPESITESAG